MSSEFIHVFVLVLVGATREIMSARLFRSRGTSHIFGAAKAFSCQSLFHTEVLYRRIWQGHSINQRSNLMNNMIEMIPFRISNLTILQKKISLMLSSSLVDHDILTP